MADRTDTIVARATAPGAAGVAIVRVAGPRAHEIAAALSGHRLTAPNRLHYCHLRDPQTGELIDRGYVAIFAAPRSFTGDDIAELQVHGAPVGVDRLVAACCGLGARLAKPGEFTWRALHNGKIDLPQAEALADLLAAQTAQQHREALAHVDGALGKRLGQLRAPLTGLLANVEARIDFAAEPHLAAWDPAPAVAMLGDLAQQMDELAATAAAARLRMRGARVVLAGAPNAGKSTLFNALCGQDRAIVDAHPGTTRDTLEAQTAPLGHLVTWVDTAGLRQTSDAVEQQGTARAEQAVADAELVLWVCDSTLPPAPPPPCRAAVLRVASKAELPRAAGYADGEPWLPVSAQTGQGISELLQAVAGHVAALAAPPRADQVAVTRQRHADALTRAAEDLRRAAEWLTGDPQLELAASDLRQAADELNEITGPLTPDDVLAAIFSSFCIGK